MLPRQIKSSLLRLAAQYPVVTVTGPRQSGKTTLCRAAFPKKPYVNLEPADVRKYANEDPRAFLKQYPAGAVLDEIQRAPGLLSYIQPLVDDAKKEGMFILTGSRQFEVMEAVTQTLSGRTALLKLLPFSIPELGKKRASMSADELIYTGFYPRIYDRKLNPTQMLADYFATYVERDLKRVVNVHDLNSFEKFVRLCAGRTGQLLNLQNLASDTGVSHTTARAWLSALEASYIVFLLQPLHENISKRLIKSSKLYFYDVGLAAYLIGIENARQVATHPLRGSLFENLVVMEAAKHRLNSGAMVNFNFFRDSAGNEVDLVVGRGPNMLPLEIKAGETVNDDYFDGLNKFSKLFPKTAHPGAVIYGGDRLEKRSRFPVYPMAQTSSLLAKSGF